MNKITTFTTPSGDKMAVLPMVDYERLAEAAEELADIAAYDAARQRLATGQDELIPTEFAGRLINGENPVRVWRDYRGLTARQLAVAAEVSPSYLSQIETGERDGTIGSMTKIARVLGVTIDDLV